MPDSGISDGSVYTSSFHDSYVRQQVVAQVTSSTRPTGVEGRLIAESDTDLLQVYDGSGWVPFGGWGSWTAFTPSWSGITVGNATNSGAYCRVGNLVVVRWSLTFGSTTTHSGTVKLAAPVTPASGTTLIASGHNLCTDAGTADYPGPALVVDDGGGSWYIYPYVVTTSGTYGTLTNVNFNINVPFTEATGDKIHGQITYEVA